MSETRLESIVLIFYFVLVRAPGMSLFFNTSGMILLKIQLSEPSSVAKDVSMWEWSGSAFDEGEEKMGLDYLGKKTPLVRFNKGFNSKFFFICNRWKPAVNQVFLFENYDTETETIPSPLAYAAGYSTTFAERVCGNPW